MRRLFQRLFIPAALLLILIFVVAMLQQLTWHPDLKNVNYIALAKECEGILQLPDPNKRPLSLEDCPEIRKLRPISLDIEGEFMLLVLRHRIGIRCTRHSDGSWHFTLTGDTSDRLLAKVPPSPKHPPLK